MLNNEILSKLAKWTGFVGIITLIMGVLQVITIVGIIPGVIMIILATKLLAAKSGALALAADGDNSQMENIFRNLAAYFHITGILFIISLIMMLLSVLIITIVGLMGVPELPWQNYLPY
ncbi:MAG: hypothetical protein FH749_10245 [Firmicutes bacterium]|nr:hypothetical protein [Bacillota bacterium]